ncbi:DUF2165 domain-containing protein [Legionella israelensis]|uniref:DUF2165 domain-containing protein n=1 Tax=Legionella israelensis TaxID=454 RepID=A0AAX1EHP9_9GAMM|nr:DUF2165 domain-containing protein [Legionella israelensis]QBR84563.1 DUF2165 domain-containing protein [Legionella israelensis]
MLIRTSKILLVAAIAFYASLTAFSNITDYATNFSAVQKVFMMKEVLPGTTITYRAINAPVIHHLGYIFIIFMESLTAILCWIGVWKLSHAVKQPAFIFNEAKEVAIAGLTIGFLTWQVTFMSIGSEWFGMWMSPQLNEAVNTAFRIFITILAVLIYLVHKDGEISGHVKKPDVNTEA